MSLSEYSCLKCMNDTRFSNISYKEPICKRMPFYVEKDFTEHVISGDNKA